MHCRAAYAKPRLNAPRVHGPPLKCLQDCGIGLERCIFYKVYAHRLTFRNELQQALNVLERGVDMCAATPVLLFAYLHGS